MTRRRCGNELTEITIPFHGGSVPPPNLPLTKQFPTHQTANATNFFRPRHHAHNSHKKHRLRSTQAKKLKNVHNSSLSMLTLELNMRLKRFCRGAVGISWGRKTSPRVSRISHLNSFLSRRLFSRIISKKSLRKLQTRLQVSIRKPQIER